MSAYITEPNFDRTVPATNTQFSRQQLARYAMLRREGTPNFRGLGQLVEATTLAPTDPQRAYTSASNGGDGGLFDEAGGFIDEWGIPIAAGLGAGALGLLIARAATRKKRRRRR